MQHDFTCTSYTTGPPGFVPADLSVSLITRVSGDQWEFFLRWEVPPEYCDLDYIFTPLQPIGQCTTTCTTECRRFRVGLGPHNFTVTAQNCGGTQNGTESEPLLMCLERKYMCKCTCKGVYSGLE